MNQQDITKEKGKDGKMIYKLKNGREISTYTEDLFDIAGIGLEQIYNFFDILIDKDPEDKDPDVGRELVEGIQAKLEGMSRFIDENFGRVEVERASHRQLGVIGGTMLGVVFEPANGKAPVTEPSRKDSPGA